MFDDSSVWPLSVIGLSSTSDPITASSAFNSMSLPFWDDSSRLPDARAQLRRVSLCWLLTAIASMFSICVTCVLQSPCGPQNSRDLNPFIAVPVSDTRFSTQDTISPHSFNVRAGSFDLNELVSCTHRGWNSLARFLLSKISQVQ